MSNITTNLYDCNHCEGKGTCRNGKDQASCAGCIKKNELKGKEYMGLLCGSCGGIGKAEPITERMNKRITPVLAIYLICFLLAMIFVAAFLKNEHFAELLAFSSAIIGSVMGYYFSKSNP